MVRVVVAIVVVAGLAFGYHQLTQQSPQQEAVSTLKRTLSVQGTPVDSVTCKASSSALPAAYANSDMKLFDCNYVHTDDGRIIDVCMFTSEQVNAKLGAGAGGFGEGTCAHVRQMLDQVSETGTVPGAGVGAPG